MISFVETMKKIKEEYNAKLDQETSNKESPLADEDFGGNAKDMVGVYDEDLQQLIDKLMLGRSYGLKTIAVVGMAGIGIEQSEVQLNEQINKFLNYRRYLIVLDDVWDNDFWDGIIMYLPNNNNRSRIIVTTRLSSLAFYTRTYVNDHEIRFRNEEESWNLFCRKVFVEDSCPPRLEKVGKKIVKKCGGLSLGIISLANILSKAEKTLDYWEKVAKNENLLALATEEGSPISDTLFLSYKHLPPHLKECCLYFGVFPLNHEISVSKLVKLWIGEGLVEPKYFKTYEDTAREYLEDLVSHNIVLVRQQSSSGKT
ncbi:hypothetical protein RD792_005271 [Penstemon davidsonii]|uniref:NB-ARC domain-containing protein n=1 Tax=Penstemon davidsonii TaxID=160366 RepID=A0ABR0DJR1_9LAMI|nr:hypothetical protein RD792_005271 [Penstemon davidsonii]